MLQPNFDQMQCVTGSATNNRRAMGAGDFKPDDHARYEALSAKAQEGTLTDAEVGERCVSPGERMNESLGLLPTTVLYCTQEY